MSLAKQLRLMIVQANLHRWNCEAEARGELCWLKLPHASGLWDRCRDLAKRMREAGYDSTALWRLREVVHDSGKFPDAWAETRPLLEDTALRAELADGTTDETQSLSVPSRPMSKKEAAATILLTVKQLSDLMESRTVRFEKFNRQLYRFDCEQFSQLPTN